MTDRMRAFPRLALPFTVITAEGRLHLIHGEDVRYSLTAGAWAEHAAVLLRQCDGSQPVDTLLAAAPAEFRGLLERLVEQLWSERVLAPGPAEAAHVAGDWALEVTGGGLLFQSLAQQVSDQRTKHGAQQPSAVVFCQDTLDYHALLEFNRQRLEARAGPWLWATTGPAARGFVSPVCLSHAGPCLACLWRQFERLSPAAELYSALREHGRAGGAFAAADFPVDGLAVLTSLVRWKVRESRLPRPALSVFQLHVLELESMEVSVHRVLADPACPECRHARLG